MKQWWKRYGVVFYAALLLLVVLSLLCWYRVPADHPDRNMKLFTKWVQLAFFSFLLVDKLSLIYQRFLKKNVHDNTNVFSNQ